MAGPKPERPKTQPTILKVSSGPGQYLMEYLSLSVYETLIRDAQCLSHDILDGKISHKVLLLTDCSIIKLFRLKRLITSARLFPYASRFRRNTIKLMSRGIPTVQVNAVYRIPAIQRTAVHYQPLQGTTLRDYGADTPIDNALARQLGNFLQTLHQHGIYFRSIHFGNIVLTPDKRIGLIDVADMRLCRGPLNTARRIRNLRHLFRYRSDAELLAPMSDIFQKAYCQHARLSLRNETRFRQHFESYL